MLLYSYYCTWLRSKTLTTPNSDKNVKPQKLIFTVWKCKIVQPLWKTVWQFLNKTKIYLLYDPAIILFGIYTNEVKTYVQMKICTWMFIVVLFRIAKTWKLLRCPLVDKCINKSCYIQTMKCYLVINKELSGHEDMKEC